MRARRYLRQLADGSTVDDSYVGLQDMLDDLMGETLTDTINEFAPTLHARQEQLITIGQALANGQGASMSAAQWSAAVQQLTDQASAAQAANPMQQSANQYEQQIYEGQTLPPMQQDYPLTGLYDDLVNPTNPNPAAPPSFWAQYGTAVLVGGAIIGGLILLPPVIRAFAGTK